MYYTYAYHAFDFGKYMYRLHSVHREWEEDVRKTFSNAVIDDLRDEGSTLRLSCPLHAIKTAV